MKPPPWADPDKCSNCGGCGKKVKQVLDERYTCGFRTEAYTCPTCHGSGRRMPVSIEDHKLAAAGESR